MKKAIFTCADGNWLDYARITIQSIVANTTDEDVFLFTTENGFTGTNLKDIEIPGCTVLELSAKLEEDSSVTCAISSEAGAALRILGFEYLKSIGYGMATYMDADAIMMKPFPPSFWNNRNGAVQDLLCSAVWGHVLSKDRLKPGYVRHHVVHSGTEYFNSGVIRANLSDSVWDGMFDRYKKYRVDTTFTGSLLDQDFLNLELTCIEFLDLSYNFSCWEIGTGYMSGQLSKWKSSVYSQDEYQSVVNHLANNAYIVHYTGNLKPWRTPKTGSMSHLWGAVGKQTPGLSDAGKQKVDRAFEYRPTVNRALYMIEYPINVIRARPSCPIAPNLEDLLN